MIHFYPQEYHSVSIQLQSFFWTSTWCVVQQGDLPSAWMRGMLSYTDEVMIAGAQRIDACSVRCIQNQSK
jgi:hypothetical protein